MTSMGSVLVALGVSVVLPSIFIAGVLKLPVDPSIKVLGITTAIGIYCMFNLLIENISVLCQNVRAVQYLILNQVGTESKDSSDELLEAVLKNELENNAHDYYHSGSLLASGTWIVPAMQIIGVILITASILEYWKPVIEFLLKVPW
jgi:hypothetical protein